MIGHEWAAEPRNGTLAALGYCAHEHDGGGCILTESEHAAQAEPVYPDWPQAAAAWLAMLDPEELEAEVLRRCDWGTSAASLYPTVLIEWILGSP